MQRERGIYVYQQIPFPGRLLKARYESLYIVPFEKVIEILEYVDNDELESALALEDRTFEDKEL